jgi:hypothetical protein
MFVSKRAYRTAQGENARLRDDLDKAQRSLAEYKNQERELVDALVSSRAEARQMRSLAEAQAHELLDRARQQASAADAQAREVLDRAQLQASAADAQSRDLLDRARAQADEIEALARGRAAAAERETARLLNVQRELSASLQQSLAAISSAFPDAAVPQRFSSGDPAAPQARPAPAVLLKPAPLQLAADVARQRDEQRSAAAAKTAVRPPAPALPAAPVLSSGAKARRTLPTWGNKTKIARARALILAAGAVVAVTVVSVATGLVGSWKRPARLARTDASPLIEVSADATTGSNVSASPALAPSPGSGRTHAGGERLTRSSSSSALTVGMSAVRPVWVRAEVDGKSEVARLLRAGESFEFRGTREVVLRAGDAGAVLLGVNGRTPTALGRDGAVVTKRIAAELPTEVGTRITGAEDSPTPVQPLLQTSTRSHSPIQPAATASPARAPAASSSRSAAVAPAAVPTSATSQQAGSPTTTQDDESHVLRAHEAYFDALRRGDSSRIGRLLADGFSASGSPAADDRGIPYEMSVRSAAVEVRGVGAIVSGTASQRLAGPNGEPTRDQQLLFSEVWVKRDGEWQLMNVRFVSPGQAR